MTASLDRPVVVGVDGSELGIAALKWAATEAWLREVDLRVLVAYHYWRMLGVHLASHGEAQRAAEQRATEIVDDAVVQARVITADVHGGAVVGSAAPTLLTSARDAGLVVVGNSGRGGFTGLLLGSVSTNVAAHASCSVAVVRGRANTAIGPVVVGVDESTSTQAALAVAFEEAALRRHAGLVAVATYTAPLAPWTGAGPSLGYDVAKVGTDLRQNLVRQTARWRERYPDVTVDHAVMLGGAAPALIERSHHAQLVVVGARTHAVFGGLTLGSVGQQLLHHADCTVLIARTRDRTMNGG
jgi:nucleotide-binding universal stress UspA family protein